MINTLQPFSGRITIYYLDSELDGIPEANLTLNVHNGILWNAYNQNVTSDGMQNFVMTDGLSNILINELTLGSIDNSLSVNFDFVNSDCPDGHVKISWSTKQETNSNYFAVEKSIGNDWTIIANLPAASNSSIQRNYSYTDFQTTDAGLYRIAETDLNGNQMISLVVHAICPTTELIEIHPNPASDLIFVHVTTKKPGIILNAMIYDSKGSLVTQTTTHLLLGNNQIPIAISTLTAGIYLLHTNWGIHSKTFKIVKN